MSTWYISTTGNDVTGTGASGAPWATLTHALTEATGVAGGDTFLVASGDYYDGDIWIASGLSGPSNTVTGHTQILGAAGISGTGRTAMIGTARLMLFGIAEETKNVTIAGFYLGNTHSTLGHGIWDATYGKSQNIVIKDNYFADIALDCIDADRCANWVVSGNTFDWCSMYVPSVQFINPLAQDATGKPVDSNATGSSHIIIDNLFVDSGGLLLNGGSTSTATSGWMDSCVVTGNVFRNSNHASIQLARTRNSEISNNLFDQCGTNTYGNHIDCSALTSSRVTGCTIQCNTLGDNNYMYNIYMGTGLNNVIMNNISVASTLGRCISQGSTTNFLAGNKTGTWSTTAAHFVNRAAGDYHLSSDSGWRDTGVATCSGFFGTVSGCVTDLDGGIRPVPNPGGFWDPGCYEYGSTLTSGGEYIWDYYVLRPNADHATSNWSCQGFTTPNKYQAVRTDPHWGVPWATTAYIMTNVDAKSQWFELDNWGANWPTDSVVIGLEGYFLCSSTVASDQVGFNVGLSYTTLSVAGALRNITTVPQIRTIDFKPVSYFLPYTKLNTTKMYFTSYIKVPAEVRVYGAELWVVRISAPGRGAWYDEDYRKKHLYIAPTLGLTDQGTVPKGKAGRLVRRSPLLLARKPGESLEEMRRRLIQEKRRRERGGL